MNPLDYKLQLAATQGGNECVGRWNETIGGLSKWVQGARLVKEEKLTSLWGRENRQTRRTVTERNQGGRIWKSVGKDKEPGYSLDHEDHKELKIARYENLSASLGSYDHQTAKRLEKEFYFPIVSNGVKRKIGVNFKILPPLTDPSHGTLNQTLTLATSNQTITLIERIEQNPPISAKPGMAVSITKHNKNCFVGTHPDVPVRNPPMLDDQVSVSRLYIHRPKKTDFLLVRRVGRKKKKTREEYTVRSMPKVVLVAGHSQPKAVNIIPSDPNFPASCRKLADFWLREYGFQDNPTLLVDSLHQYEPLQEAVSLTLSENYTKKPGQGETGYTRISGRIIEEITPVEYCQLDVVFRDISKMWKIGITDNFLNGTLSRLRGVHRFSGVQAEYEKVRMAQITLYATQVNNFRSGLKKDPGAGAALINLAKMTLSYKDFKQFIQREVVESSTGVSDSDYLLKYFTPQEVDSFTPKQKRAKVTIFKSQFAKTAATTTPIADQYQTMFNNEVPLLTQNRAPLSVVCRHLTTRQYIHDSDDDLGFNDDPSEARPVSYHLVKVNLQTGHHIFDRKINRKEYELWSAYSSLYGKDVEQQAAPARKPRASPTPQMQAKRAKKPAAKKRGGDGKAGSEAKRRRK